MKRRHSFCIIGSYPPDPDGLSTATYYLTKALMGQGHIVSVIALSRRFALKRIRDEGVDVIFVKYGLFPMPFILFMLGLYFALRPVDFVHINRIEGLFFVLGNRLFSTERLIFSFRDSGVASYIKSSIGRNFFNLATRILVSWAYRIHVPVNAVRVNMMSRYRVDGTKIFCVPSGILVDKHPISSHANTEKPMLLYVGRLEKHKGVHLLLQACKVLKERGIRDFSLLIVGEGSEMPYLREMAKKLYLDDVVVFMGAIPIAKVMKLMHKTYCVFGMGKVVYEAMSAMRPVVGLFDTSFQPQFVAWHKKEIQEGVIICPSLPDPYALADVIESLLRNSEQSLRYGQKAYEFVLKNYDMRRLINSYINSLCSHSYTF